MIIEVMRYQEANFIVVYRRSFISVSSFLGLLKLSARLKR